MYAIVDIETSGGNYQTAKITEIAIIIFDGEKICDSFVSLINPECYIPDFITKITGITNEMVKNSPKFYEVARKIVEITANRIFVAHNANFDYNFIKKEFKELGYDFSRKTICTVELSRKLMPNHASYSLGNICNDLNITINGRHRAEGDATATTELFRRLLVINNQNQKSIFSQG